VDPAPARAGAVAIALRQLSIDWWSTESRKHSSTTRVHGFPARLAFEPAQLGAKSRKPSPSSRDRRVVLGRLADQALASSGDSTTS